MANKNTYIRVDSIEIAYWYNYNNIGSSVEQSTVILEYQKTIGYSGIRTSTLKKLSKVSNPYILW